jgi:hypothetical protein
MTIDEFTVFHRPDGPKGKGTRFAISNFVSTAQQLARKRDLRDLVRAYNTNLRVAPRRRQTGKRYILETHQGNLDALGPDVSSEDRFSMALRNASKDDGKHLTLPKIGRLELVEYQMPFNAQRGDVGVKAADLFGLVRGNLPCVVEMKMDGESASGQDTPLYAILQGLTYCSLVQANGLQIAEEAGLAEEDREHFGSAPPALIIMAPTRYWVGYKNHPKARGWADAIGRLAGRLEEALDLDIHLIALDCELDEAGRKFTLEGGIRPRLVGECRCKEVSIPRGGSAKF